MQQVTDITIHMHKNDGLENYKKKTIFFFFVFSYPGGPVSLMGVRESGSNSGSLPDNPGGFTCMKTTMIVSHKNRLLKTKLCQ